jgi:hypothetical protein
MVSEHHHLSKTYCVHLQVEVNGTLRMTTVYPSQNAGTYVRDYMVYNVEEHTPKEDALMRCLTKRNLEGCG